MQEPHKSEPYQTKATRIAQLKAQIKVLEQQLDNAKRDLKQLEKSESL